MAVVEVFLGNPPADIVDWIRNHSQPTGHSDTRVTYQPAAGIEDWSGEIVGKLTYASIPNMAFANAIDIGTSITIIGSDAFNYVGTIPQLIIPSTVTTIESGAFYYSTFNEVTISSGEINIGETAFELSKIKSIVFQDRTIEQVQSMTNYPFGLEYSQSDVTIHCTDGDIPISVG